MESPKPGPHVLIAVFCVLAALVASHLLLVSEMREGNGRLALDMAELKDSIAAARTSQKGATEKIDSLQQQVLNQGAALEKLQDAVAKQAEGIGALQKNTPGAAAPAEDVTPAQRTAAEKYYKQFIEPDSKKTVSRQVPAATDRTMMQGLKINKWLAFSSSGDTATLVGTGQPFLNIKPEELNNSDYYFANQGRTLTMIVVNFKIKDDTVFAQCKKSLAAKMPENHLIAIFGHGIAEEVLHDSFSDEVIIDLDQLSNCGLQDNP